MEISTQVVAILGIGAVLKYGYQVFYQKIYKGMGAFITMLYLTLVYFMLSEPGFSYHRGMMVRVGIILLFLDKILVFIFDLLLIKWYKSLRKFRNRVG